MLQASSEIRLPVFHRIAARNAVQVLSVIDMEHRARAVLLAALVDGRPAATFPLRPINIGCIDCQNGRAARASDAAPVPGTGLPGVRGGSMTIAPQMLAGHRRHRIPETSGRSGNRGIAILRRKSKHEVMIAAH
jgi:hypothetical protein